MRIPATLQAVFMASNRGNEVHKPPPESVASRTFFLRKNWFRRRRDDGQSMDDIDETKENDDACSIDNTSVKSSLSIRSNRSSRSALDKSRRGRFPFSRSNSSRRSIETSNSSSRSIASVGTAVISPQSFLDKLLRSRGYSTKRYKALHTAYHNQPTKLQQASYGVHLVSLTRSGKLSEVERILRSGGVSPNPCNRFGESLIHAICREGHNDMMHLFLDCGASLQVTDDYGRTPLHDACWAATPCFEIIDMILQYDVRLIHMADCRGAVPLSYLRKENWDIWIEWLDSKKDIFWPDRTIVNDICAEQQQQPPPRLAELPPNSCPIPDPEKAFPAELAKMVTEGKLDPQEAKYVIEETTEYDCSADGSEEEDDDDSYVLEEGEEDEDDSEDERVDEDDDYIVSLDYCDTGYHNDADDVISTYSNESFTQYEEEMADLLHVMSNHHQKNVAWAK